MAATFSSTPNHPTFTTPRADPVWAPVLDSLGSEIGARELQTLVEHSRFLQRDGALLPAAIDNRVAAHWQRDGRLQALCSAVDATGQGLRLAVTPVCREALLRESPHRRLADVVVNDANRDAYRHVVGGQRGISLLVGPEASGKTHLLLGLAQRAAEDSPVLFVSGDALTLDLVSGVQEQRLEAVRERFRAPELLIVDQLECLAGRAGSQNELTAALTDHARAGGRVVLASRHAPDALSRMRPAFRRALESARCFWLRPPARLARIEILRQRIASWQVRSVPEAASWLSRELGGDFASLDALLTRTLAHPTCRDGLIDPERHGRELDPHAGPRLRPALAPAAVLGLVCRDFNVKLSDLLGTGRGPRVTQPRQIAMYLLRHRSRLSYPEIGQRLRRHHTTALHGCRRIDERRGEDASLAAALELLEKELDQTSKTTAERRG